MSKVKLFELELKRNRSLEHVEKILDESPPALREKLDWIGRTFEEDWKRSIVSRYQIAVAIREVYDDVAENNGSVYGAKAVQAIKGALGCDDGLIYQAINVADAFTPEQIEEITGMRLPGGQPLSFSHVVALSRVEDEGRRQKLLKQTVKEGLTAKRLEIAAKLPAAPEQGKPPERRGRPIGKPRTFDAVLDQQASFARDFLNRNDQVWSHTDHSLSAKALMLNTTDYTPERVERLKAHAEQMKLLAQKATERAEEASAIHTRFTEALKGRDGKKRKVGPPRRGAVDRE